MLEVLDRKVRQMHEALGNLENQDLSHLKSTHVDLPGGFYSELDFGQGQTPTRLANTASLLIANIASLKDHLKVWCEKNGQHFAGDDLINSNQDVALVHDLWNLDKHAKLLRPPRSGILPTLRDLRQDLKLSTSTVPNSSGMLQWDPRTGEIKVQTTGGATASLVIDADVVDEQGNKFGTLAAICERAATEWEKILAFAGVQVPDRS